MATYVCLLLVISDSVFSIKTGALLWFMLGSSEGAGAASSCPARSRRDVPVPDVMAPASAA